MRWALCAMAMVGLGCGPAVSEPDPGSGQDGSSGGASTSTTAAGSTTAADTSSSTTPTTAASTGMGEGSSSGVAPDAVEPEAYEGIWVCETAVRTFGLFVDDYAGGQDISGRVCVPLGNAPDPPEWQPCGDLSLHPVEQFAIFAMVPAPEGGEPWDVSAFLFPNESGDGLEGFMAGPGESGGETVACKRWP
ncbi:MAG: hypothetical protein AAGA54_26340 [Myxococcota bacterium]